LKRITLFAGKNMAFRDTSRPFAAVLTRNAMLRCGKYGQCLTTLNAGSEKKPANPQPRRTAT
jgi:hypothetical protein